MLSFEEGAHLYRWDGKPVPNVTRIIAPLTDYSRIPPERLERARQEGQHIHKMVELHFRDDLQVDFLPPWMRGHYAALLRFVEETGYENYAAERRLYHRTMGYAGTMDLAGQMHRLKRARPAVIDVKRSLYAGPAIGLQDAGYLDASNSEKELPRLDHRYALVLRADGSYRLEPYEDRDDHAAFLACLQQLRWREKHYGGTNGPN
jgi:hypothetical protein